MPKKIVLFLFVLFVIADSLYSEVIVYKRKTIGSQYVSLNANQQFYRQIFEESGFLVVEYTPATDTYANAKLVRYGADNSGKYQITENYLNGRAIFQKGVFNGKEQLLISGFNDNYNSEAASGRVSTVDIMSAGGVAMPVRIAKSYSGVSTWDIFRNNRLSENVGSCDLTMSIDLKRTRNANISGQTAQDVVNDIQAYLQTIGYLKPNPVAVNDSVEMLMNENISISVLNNDYDLNSEKIEVEAIVVSPSKGIAVINQDSPSSETTVVYTPDTDFFGEDKFVYRIRNQSGGTATATVIVNVLYTHLTTRISLTQTQTELEEPTVENFVASNGRVFLMRSNSTFGAVTGAGSIVTNLMWYDNGRRSLINSLMTVNTNANNPYPEDHAAIQEFSLNGAVLNSNGQYSVFTSASNNLLESLNLTDTNDFPDVFQRTFPADATVPEDVNIYVEAVVGLGVIGNGPYRIDRTFLPPNNYVCDYAQFTPSNIEFIILNPPSVETWVYYPWWYTPITLSNNVNYMSQIPWDNTVIASLPVGDYYCDFRYSNVGNTSNPYSVVGEQGNLKLLLRIIPAPFTRVSEGNNGEEANGPSSNGVTSENATSFAFQSLANNLVADDTNGKWDIFIRTYRPMPLPPATVRIKGTNGAQAMADCINPSISSDGRFVVFQSKDKGNLDPAANNGKSQIFLHDRDVDGNGTFDEPGNVSTTLISRVSGGGAQGDDDSENPYIVGTFPNIFVVYQSLATNLDSQTPDTNGVYDVYMYNMALNTTTRISINGTIQGNGSSARPKSSQDGLYVVFESDASNLVANDQYGYKDILMKDIAKNKIYMISRNNKGIQANGPSQLPNIANFVSNGTNYLFVSYSSLASNLVENDNNGVADVFLCKWKDTNN